MKAGSGLAEMSQGRCGRDRLAGLKMMTFFIRSSPGASATLAVPAGAELEAISCAR
jgi:hypothetical protein